MTTPEAETGYDRERCGATRKGNTCNLPAGWGTDHVGIGRCRLHGGSTPTHKQNALATMAEREVSKWGARRDISYPEAMLEVVQWKATEVQFWQSKVDSLGDDELTWGRTRSVDRTGTEAYGSGTETIEEAVPHIYLKQLHEAQRDLVAACASAARVGVDAALVGLAQSRAALWLGAMRRMLADSRVTVQGDAEAVLFDALRELQTS